ncbi:hypothetical protein ABPG75_000491 [Micractinium tetrahymenae]
MVTATLGVLISGDVSLIEYIRVLDEQLPPAERFIIVPKGGPLDDTHLLVKDSKALWVQEKAVQRERAAAYRRFDNAFRAYLQTKAEGPYRHTMAQLTGQFQELSQQVRAAEEGLQAAGQGELTALLRTVQENEREKLRLTLALHALKSAHAQQRFSWQHEEAAGSLPPGMADLLQGHLCGIGCLHEAPADEPTQAEYAAAVKETYQLLQGAVTAINEAIEEVQQAAADLLEQ